jgi:hypothetical protein
MGNLRIGPYFAFLSKFWVVGHVITRSRTASGYVDRAEINGQTQNALSSRLCPEKNPSESGCMHKCAFGEMKEHAIGCSVSRLSREVCKGLAGRYQREWRAPLPRRKSTNPPANSSGREMRLPISNCSRNPAAISRRVCRTRRRHLSDRPPIRWHRVFDGPTRGALKTSGGRSSPQLCFSLFWLD